MSQKSTKSDSEDVAFDNLDLETSFPNPADTFEPYLTEPVTSENVIVALDTNVLLLPYQIRQDDLQSIVHVYEALAKANRLFIPERVVREFGKHRERRLADMVAALSDKKSRLPTMDRNLSPILSGLEANKSLLEAHDKLLLAKKEYGDALSSLMDSIRSWRGNDPVSELYRKAFKERIVGIDAVETPATLRKEWDERSATKRPPGYKDASKDDGGIGDFLIWKTLLSLGKMKKDLVFVTNEAKADWFVRSGKEPLYPRPELVAEYRQASDGKSLRLCSLHELLGEMDVDQNVVSEVQKVEVANSAVSRITLEPVTAGVPIIMSGWISFDYSTNNGLVEIICPPDSRFLLHFSKGSDRAVHVYNDNLIKIARIKDPASGGRVLMDALETSSRSYLIQLGEAFVAQNIMGQILVGVITSIHDDRRGSLVDEVVFRYNITAGPDIGLVP